MWRWKTAALAWLWGAWVCAAALGRPAAAAHDVNTLTRGGVIEHWRVTNPLAAGGSPVNRVDRAAADIRSVNDLRSVTGGGVSPRRMVDRGAGVDLDSVARADSHAVIYAFCRLECFDSSSYHAYLAASGAASLWINGTPIMPSVQAAQGFAPPGTHARATLHPGINSVLVKCAAAGAKLTFSLRMYRDPDSLRAYAPFLDTLHITLNRQTLSLLEDTLRCTVESPVRPPRGAFGGTITLATDDDSVVAKQRFALGEPASLPAPASYTGPLFIEAHLDSSPGVAASGSRRAFRGDFASSVSALADTAASLRAELSAAHGGRGRTAAFAARVYEFALAWVSRIEPASAARGGDRAIWRYREARRVCAGARAFLGSGALPAGKLMPLYIPAESMDAPDDSLTADAAWLAYKYPERFVRPSAADAVNGFEAWLFIPRAASGRKRLPCMLMLHGAAQRSGTLEGLRTTGPLAYATRRPDFDALVLAPLYQGPSWWPAGKALRVAERFLSLKKIDRRRFWIAGWDMGGFAAWSCARRDPEACAAIVSVSAGGDPRNLCALKRVAVKQFHALEDPVIPSTLGREMHEALQSCGARVAEFVVYPGGGHHIWPEVFASPTLYSWLERQKR
jgi:pimeloyl-ACP methyl ester carboxylesterase